MTRELEDLVAAARLFIHGRGPGNVEAQYKRLEKAVLAYEKLQVLMERHGG